MTGMGVGVKTRPAQTNARLSLGAGGGRQGDSGQAGNRERKEGNGWKG
jgi:hypothetical protein